MEFTKEELRTVLSAVLHDIQNTADTLQVRTDDPCMQSLHDLKDKLALMAETAEEAAADGSEAPDSGVGAVEVITPAEAARRMRLAGMSISASVIRDGLKQQRFPFGDAIENGSSDRCRFFVYTRLLNEWLERRNMRR